MVGLEHFKLAAPADNGEVSAVLARPTGAPAMLIPWGMERAATSDIHRCKTSVLR